MKHKTHKNHMKNVNTATIDLDTGEILPYAIVAKPAKKAKSIFSDAGFLIVSQEYFMACSKSPSTARRYRVFYCLLAHAEMDNWVSVNQSLMADLIGIQRTHFCTELKQLITDGLVWPPQRIGMRDLYRIDPRRMFRGSTSQHFSALAKLPPEKKPAPKKRKIKKSATVLKLVKGGKT